MMVVCKANKQPYKNYYCCIYTYYDDEEDWTDDDSSVVHTHTHTHGIQHAGSGAADLKLRTTEDTNEAPQEETGQPIQEKVQ